MNYIYYACYESDKINYHHSSIGASNTLEGLLELVDEYMGVGTRIKYESHYSKYPNSNELEGTITYETPEEERVSVYMVDFNQK
jgi:hypothetical protein